MTTGPVLSSDQVAEQSFADPDPAAEVDAEDLLLLGDPDLDQDGGEDEYLGQERFLDDTDEDGDPLNEASGLRSGLGADLDIPDEDLDDSDMTSEPEEDDDFLGSFDGGFEDEER